MVEERTCRLSPARRAIGGPMRGGNTVWRFRLPAVACCVLLCAEALASPKKNAPPAAVPPPPAAVVTQPIVQILSPSDGTEFADSEMVVQVSVQLPEGQTLVALRALIDGRMAGQTRGLKLPSTAPGDANYRRLANSVTVTLPPQDCILTVLAKASQSKGPPHEADPEAIKRTMLPEAEIRGTLSAIARKVLLFLDSCHSGKVFSGTQTHGADALSLFISELASSDSGVVVFAASTGRQASQEAAAWSNGAFTKALIEGLNGRADYRKSGRITLNMLDLYISERVKELTLLAPIDEYVRFFASLPNPNLVVAGICPRSAWRKMARPSA